MLGSVTCKETCYTYGTVLVWWTEEMIKAMKVEIVKTKIQTLWKKYDQNTEWQVRSDNYKPDGKKIQSITHWSVRKPYQIH